MKYFSLKTVSLFLLLVIQICSACAGKSNAPEFKETPPVQQATTTTKSQPTEKSEPIKPSSINNLIDSEKAVIRIESMGEFSDPKTGELNYKSGFGSGFIIHPSGIAVTANRVVAGAEDIKIWLGGDSQNSYRAELLASSACANLAIIDIDGEGFSYFDWSQDSPEVGQELYSAGFNLESDGYKLSRGIIISPDVEGNRSWVFVDSLLEHTADAAPGFGGGPLLSEDAKVVGVNFGESRSGNQKFAISNQIAKSIIEDLLSNNLENKIGISGELFFDEEEQLSGIWLTAVDPGSFAAQAGLEIGDVITKFNNREPTADGTLEDFCNSVYQFNADNPLQVEVFRLSTGQEFQGSIGKDVQLSSAIPENGQKTPLVEQTQMPLYTLNTEATQPGETIFDYDFTSEISDWETFLTNGDPNSVRSEFIDENLHIEFSNIYTYQYFIFDLFDANDVKLDLRASNLGGNNNNISLICRYSAEGWYEFNVASNGLYWIYHYDPKLEDPYKQLWNGGSQNINLGKEENEYTAICKADQLSLRINGFEAITISDQTLSSGKAGFSVSSYNVTPVIVEVDHFSASIPD